MTRTFTIEEEGFPDLPQMMLLTVQALKQIGGSASIQELDETVVEIEGVSEEEQSIMMPNGRYVKVNYYLAWARTYLKRGNAIDNSSRGVWSLTEIGEGIEERAQTEAIFNRVQDEEKERARLKRLAKADKKRTKDALKKTRESEQTELGLEDENNGVSEIGGWKDQLLDVLKAMEPSAFERLSQRLLREAGFVKVEVRGKVADGGIDGLGVLRVNLVSFQVYFQCKRYKGSVGSKEIRDFRGALQGRADKGLFITTGTFTSQASEEATRDGAIAIDLIDGDRLCELLKQYELGVKTTMIESVDVNQVWFDGI